jgi:hypothetical protein
MKYTRNCCFIVLSLCLISFLTTKAPLTAECVAETYKMRVVPVLDLIVLANARGSVSDHQKLLLLYSSVYFCRAMQYAEKGDTFSTSFTMNLLSTAMRPVNFCTSFLVCGGCI